MTKHKKSKGDNGYTDEQLFPNEEERIKVLSLTELAREQYISQRVEQLNQEKERAELLSKRTGDLDKNKRKDHDKSNFIDNSGSESGEISKKSDDDDWSDDSKKLNKKRKSSSSSDSSESSLSNSEMEIEKKKGSINLSIAEIEKVKVTRQFFEKFYEIPIFDSNIKGAFVKINICASKSIGSQDTGYILGQIKDIIINKDKPYNFLGKQCVKYINVSHANKDKAFTYFYISNSNLNENELIQWKQHMEKHNLAFPTSDDLKSLTERLIKIRDFKYSNEELSKMITKKKEEKIKNRDKNINITYEFDLLNEKYNSAKIKYEETKDEKYLEIAEKVLPEIQSLKKMKEERELRESQRSEKDLVTQINKKNLERQRQEDLKFSLIHKKRERDVKNVFNPYKRKDCKPMNLFDSGYVKNKANEESNDKNNIHISNEENMKKEEIEKDQDKADEENKQQHISVYQQMKNIEKKIKSLSGRLEEAMNNIKNNTSTSNDNIDMKLFFSLANINKDHFDALVQNQNEKLAKIPKVTVIPFSNLEINK